MKKDLLIYILGFVISYLTLPQVVCYAFILSTILVLIGMPKFINYLNKVSIKQTEAEYTLEKKTGTPIMGGLFFILVAILVTFILVPEKTNITLWMLILGTVGFGLVGFLDDISIVLKHNNAGLKARTRLFLEAFIGLVMIVLLQVKNNFNFLPNASLFVWLTFIIFVLIMFMGATNAVNLTDGMDGLAAGVSMIAFIVYLIFVIQKAIPIIDIFCASMIGSLFAYLRYNHKPAKVFMGDTGSLALGGSLATIALLTNTEAALILIAGIPVLEALSVIIQISSVKLFHRRVFPYTPIHYSFKIKGMKEVQIVYLFWIIEFLLAFIGLYLLIH